MIYRVLGRRRLICELCNEVHEEEDSPCPDDYEPPQLYPCHTCAGSGEVNGDYCDVCDGFGELEDDE